MRDVSVITVVRPFLVTAMFRVRRYPKNLRFLAPFYSSWRHKLGRPPSNRTRRSCRAAQVWKRLEEFAQWLGRTERGLHLQKVLSQYTSLKEGWLAKYRIAVKNTIAPRRSIIREMLDEVIGGHEPSSNVMLPQATRHFLESLGNVRMSLRDAWLEYLTLNTHEPPSTWEVVS